MALLAHILIAVASVLYTSYLFFFPTQKGLKAAQALIGLTLASGTYLVVLMPSAMVQSCMSGLAYIAMVSIGLALAKGRLVAQTEKHTA